VYDKRTMAKIKNNLMRRLWKKSDDAISTTLRLSEIYDNVPKELDISVKVDEFHAFKCDAKKKKKVLAWLNSDNK